MTSRLQTVLAIVNTAAIAGVGFALAGHQRASDEALEELRAQVRRANASTDANLAGRRAAAETAMRMWAANATHPSPAPSARPGPPEAAPSGEAEDSGGDVPPPPPIRPPPASFEQSRTRVSDAFAAEPVDGDWSARASKTLDDAFRAHLPGTSRVKSLECRATLCRVELVHRAQADHGAFLMNGLRTWPGSVFIASEAQEGNDYVVTLLASKEGTNPPL
ncbi:MULTISPECIES: hypothetical protein [unclassified Corallococcus]|uniref:hypothetical protein n=1 Tax=unclassified Corallococcus TaxID=2685029 RepID=UPI001A8DDBF1|nr:MULTISPECIES: hypothetical protein [unclassified Corallococcus]MBN9688031.1 hypothetical protein [Corallococcus sp. NCSPR001]WAS88159.1 hypothetical protein O0N60_14525 [Corallococcus sp. NCRR]